MRQDILNATPENPAEISVFQYKFIMENYPVLKPAALRWVAEKSIVIVPDSCYTGGTSYGL